MSNKNDIVFLNEAEANELRITLTKMLSILNKNEEILNTPISDLPLDLRAWHVAQVLIQDRFGIEPYGINGNEQRVKHLITFSEEDFLRMRNCGTKTLQNIKNTLLELGLTLR